MSRPRKQRHTGAQLFRRLRDEEQYVGSYDQVRRYVAATRDGRRNVSPFVVRARPTGQSDFGQIWVDFPEGRPGSDPAGDVGLLERHLYDCVPSEKTEAILHGTVAAFAFFRCVPKELWWDNPRTVATTILRGRQRELNQRWQAWRVTTTSSRCSACRLAVTKSRTSRTG